MIFTHPIEGNGKVLIRTKQMKEGIPPYWSYEDVAHIWINDTMYRVTRRGSLIRAVHKLPHVQSNYHDSDSQQ